MLPPHLGFQGVGWVSRVFMPDSMCVQYKIDGRVKNICAQGCGVLESWVYKYLCYLERILQAQQDRADNGTLRAENENLRQENFRLQRALSNVVCPNCGGPGMLGGEMDFDEHQLRLENARLREEVYYMVNLIICR